MSLTLLNDAQSTAIQCIEQDFVRAGDWLQPTGGIPLVRAQVADGRYRVQRRRKPHTAWVTIVDIGAEEFDARAFKTWVTHFRLVA